MFYFEHVYRGSKDSIKQAEAAAVMAEAKAAYITSVANNNPRFIKQFCEVVNSVARGEAAEHPCEAAVTEVIPFLDYDLKLPGGVVPSSETLSTHRAAAVAGAVLLMKRGAGVDIDPAAVLLCSRHRVIPSPPGFDADAVFKISFRPFIPGYRCSAAQLNEIYKQSGLKDVVVEGHKPWDSAPLARSFGKMGMPYCCKGKDPHTAAGTPPDYTPLLPDGVDFHAADFADLAYCITHIDPAWPMIAPLKPPADPKQRKAATGKRKHGAIVGVDPSFENGTWADKAVHVLTLHGWDNARLVGTPVERDGSMYVDVQCDGDCPMCHKSGGHNNCFCVEYRQNGGGEADEMDDDDATGGYSMTVKSHSNNCVPERLNLFSEPPCHSFTLSINDNPTAHEGHADYADLYGSLANNDMLVYRADGKLYRRTPARYEQLDDTAAIADVGRRLTQFVESERSKLTALQAMGTSLQIGAQHGMKGLGGVIMTLGRARTHCKSSGFLSAVLKLYKGANYTDEKFQFDTNKDLLHFRNAMTFDLSTGITRPTRPDDFNTLVCGDYDWTGNDPVPEEDAVVDKFFSEIFPDPAVRGVAHKILGYMITGHRPVRRFFNFTDVRNGANGKSQMRAALDLALGTRGGKMYNAVPDFCYVSTGGKAGDHNTYMLNLAGRTACVMEELDPKRRFDTETMKQYTSGADQIIPVRPAYGSRYIDIDLQAKFVFCFNEGKSPNWELDLPNGAFVRRMLVVPMEAKFVPADSTEYREARANPWKHPYVVEARPNFVQTTLKQRGAAIMRWLIQGYNALMATGDPAGALDDVNLPKKMLEFKTALLYLSPKMRNCLDDLIERDGDMGAAITAESVWRDYKRLHHTDKPDKKIQKPEFFDTLKLFINGGRTSGDFYLFENKEDPAKSCFKIKGWVLKSRGSPGGRRGGAGFL